MKGAGWLGIVAIGAGVLLMWAGFKGEDPLAVLRSILTNTPLPDELEPAGATTGSTGGSGFTPTGGAAGQGAGNTNGGGW